MRYFINECHDGKDGGLIATAISPSSGSPGVTSCVFLGCPIMTCPARRRKMRFLWRLRYTEWSTSDNSP